MAIKRKCSAKVPDMYGIPNVHPCMRSATVERDGKRYCWQHDPERVKVDKKRRRMDQEIKQKVLVNLWKRRAYNARLAQLVTTEMPILLIRLANNAAARACKTDGPDEAWVRQWHDDAEAARALAVRIWEALDEH